MTKLASGIVMCLISILTLQFTLAQTTNSSQLDFEAAIRILDKGEYAEALLRFDKLLYAGFTDDKIYHYRGTAKLNLEDFKGAAEDLDKVKEGENPEILGMLGICKFQLHEWEAAKYFLIEATNAGYKNSKAHLYLGYLYHEGHQYNDCVTQLTKAEVGGESENKLFRTRGVAAYYAGDFELAIQDLRKTIEENEHSLRVYELLGLSYARNDKLKEGFRYLKKADSLESKNKDVYFELGNSFLQKELFTQAIEAYTKSISLNYNKVDVFINRGNAKLRQGLIAESLVDFDKVIEADPQNAEAYRTRAAANLKLEDWTKVITDLAIANALNSDGPGNWILSSVAKYNLKNFRGALEDANAAISKGNTHYVWEGKKHAFNYQKGKCLVALNQYDAAATALNEAQKEGENTVELYLERARAYVGLGQFENAITDLESAQKLDPKNGRVFYNSAVMKEELKDYGAAVLDYNKAISLNSKDDAAYYGRANSKARKGDSGAAIKDLDKAIMLNDKEASYFKLRGNLLLSNEKQGESMF